MTCPRCHKPAYPDQWCECDPKLQLMDHPSEGEVLPHDLEELLDVQESA